MQDKDRLTISGGRRLGGEFAVHGAKNAVLPLIASALLADGETEIIGCPDITDVSAMLSLIGGLGAEVIRDGDRVCISGRAKGGTAEEHVCSLMRSSMFLLGALLSTTGEVRLPMPGGCDIGSRPLDIHIDGIKRMGAEVAFDGDVLVCKAGKLHGADILLRYPSVGATENLLMCASKAIGVTRLVNCAREPEVVCLAHALNAMGAKIRGAGSSTITIEGVQTLRGTTLHPGGDRIEAGTVLAAVAACGGDVLVRGADSYLMQATLGALSAMGCDISFDDGAIRLRSSGELNAVNIIAAPYPLIPTDMQPQLASCLTLAKGNSRVTETVFDSRFAYVGQLEKMGADIRVIKNVAHIRGVDRLHPANICAKDLRGGAALIIAAMAAEGKSTLSGAQYLNRGYQDFASSFNAIGADIRL